MLDRKPVRTPGKKLAVLPSHPLALAVAAEWEWQVRHSPAYATAPPTPRVRHRIYFIRDDSYLVKMLTRHATMSNGRRRRASRSCTPCP